MKHDTSTKEGRTQFPELAEACAMGLQLCRKLHEIGTRVKAIQEETSQLAESIQMHRRVLDTLSPRLTSSESVYNEKAAVLVRTVVSSTIGVFQLIGTIVPSTNPDHFAFGLLVKQKLKTVCRKTTVKNLVQKIEFLRCTAQLLITTLIIGEKIRWARIFANGVPSERAMYETIRIDDKPAKYCLSDSVLATIRSVSTECQTTTTLLPFDLDQSLIVPTTLEDSNTIQEEHIADHMEKWWVLLLAEWTRSTAVNGEETMPVKNEKRPKVKRPEATLESIVQEVAIEGNQWSAWSA